MMISTRPTSERTSVGVSESGRAEYLEAHFSSVFGSDMPYHFEAAPK